MRRPSAGTSAANVLPTLVGHDDSNPEVSQVSRFRDDVWDFSNENQNPTTDMSSKRIRWAFVTPDGRRFTDPEFRRLCESSKQFIYALLWHPVDESPFVASAAVQLFCRMKHFITHLLAYQHPVLRFKDVLPHHCEDYVESVLAMDLSASYKYNRIHILQKLFQYRHVMTDGLVVDPFQGKPPVRKIAGYSHASELETQTEIIPDDILGPLVRLALEYVGAADYVFDAFDGTERIRRAGCNFEYRAKHYLRELTTSSYGLEGTRFAGGIRTVRQLHQELGHLQTACFVLIAFATGMRISEILSLRKGCCEIQEERGQPDLVWLRSRVFKMQGVPAGRPARWLGGPVCAKAVTVLERLIERLRQRTKAPYLWQPTAAFRRHRASRPLLAISIAYKLKIFVAQSGIKDARGQPFHVHPHMFRRTFARHVARHDTTNLLALQEHFKHASLWMTDYYVGNDHELWTLMIEEEEKLYLESFDKALRSDRLAGSGGTHLKKKIDEAIADGRLPKDFRGEAGTVTSAGMLVAEVATALRCCESTARGGIDRACREHAIIAVADGYQPVGAAVMESVVASYLRGLLSGVPGSERNLFSGNLAATVAGAIETYQSSTGLHLNAAQRRAVEMAIHHPLSVLTGGAGTGKTTVLRVIRDVAERTGVPVLQMALSGRAAHRLREATGREASTIAAFLRAAARGLVDPDSEPLIIIDESSMLDLPLTYSLVRALPARARLLLVGDPYQLPPIGFGLIFQVLAGSPNVPRVELVEIHRQARSSGIPQIAQAVRHGSVPGLADFTGRTCGVNFIETADDALMDSLLRVLTEWSECDDVQILGVIKRGANGVRAINATMHVYASAGKKKLDGWDLAEGEPIVYLVNDYRRGLWNGSLGRIDRVMSSAGRRSLVCFLDGAEHELPEEDFQNVDLAYAITVHKAQGSQFKRVIIPVTRSRLLDRTLIYTALTRGIEQVVFIGDRNAFERAIVAAPHSQGRQVGFSM